MVNKSGQVVDAQWDPGARRGIVFERMGRAILIETKPVPRFSTETLVRIAESVDWDSAG